MTECGYLQFVFFAVDDDGRDLLIEKDEDGAEQRRDYGKWNQPVIRHFQRIYHPASVYHKPPRTRLLVQIYVFVTYCSAVIR